MPSAVFLCAILATFALDTTGAADFAATPTSAAAAVTSTPAPFSEPLPTVLRALDAATDSTGRMAAVNELASFGDVRLLPVFSVLLRDNDFLIARQTVRALANITAPTSTDLLRQVAMRWPSITAEVAFDSLGKQQTLYAAESLHDLQGMQDLDAQRRRWAADAIQTYYPQYLDRFPPMDIGSGPGRTMFVIASGELAALNLMAVGFLGLNPELGAPLGFVSGAAIGLGGGYLATRDRPISSVQGYRMLSYTNWGALSGLLIGVGAANDYAPKNTGRLTAGFAALGATAGYLVALNDDGNLSTDQQMLIDMSGLAGLAVGGGILNWLPDSNRALGGLAILDGAALAGLTTARVALPKLRIEDNEGSVYFSTAFLGGWYAPWIAYAADPRSNQSRIWGWSLVGVGTGWFAGLALAHYTENAQDTVETADVFFAYGSFLGAGALMAAGRNPNERSGTVSLLAGGTSGLLLGSVAASRFELSPADEALVLISTAYGVYQGMGFAAYAEQEKHRRTGWGFVGGTAGAAAALGASAIWNFTPALTGAILSGTGLGAWTSVLGGDRFGLDGNDLLLASLIGTNSGLVTTLILVGPLEVAPDRIGWAGVFALGGAGLGATGAALATAERNGIETAALAGTGVGAAVGAIVAPYLKTPKMKLGAALPERFQIQPWMQRIDGTSLPGLQVSMHLE